MAMSAKGFAVSAGAAVSLILLSMAIGQPARSADAQPASTVTSGGVTLRSLSLTLPDDARTFPGGDKAGVANADCLTCHSAGMALTQPKLPRSAWQGEVEKMINDYKAPVAENDVPAIVDYLANLNDQK
jgi:hypothetical protein